MNTKKILLTTYYLDMSGSSTFLQTLALFLKLSDYSVIIFAIVIDPETKKRLTKKGIHVVDNLDNLIKTKINYIIGQHTIPTILIRNIFRKEPLIYISHGILSQLEDTPSIDLNISWYFAISEEIKEKMIKKNKVDPKKIGIIRNFVDTNRFNIEKKINKKLKKVLFISSRYTQNVLKNIQDACLDMNLQLTILGKNKKDYSVEKYINNADLVISLGRGAIEGLSCGRPVIVYDYQGGDGIITTNNFKQIEKNNFSGRRYKKKFTKKDLINEFKKYNTISSNEMRNIALINFNVKIESQKILDILITLKPNNKQPTYNIPQIEMQWLIKRIAYFAKIKKA